MKAKSFLKLIIFILICEGAGIIGSFFTVPAIPIWFASLVKPAFAPPNWLFGPVWTTLYALMGIALWLVMEKQKQGKDDRFKINQCRAIIIFIVQLILNSVWSVIFFGGRAIGVAFFELVVLWLAVVATIYFFQKISRPAAWLLLPYLLWITFAGALNLSLWGLNEGFWLWEKSSASTPIAPKIETSLPQGYSNTAYTIEKVTETTCRESADCETPMEYRMLSHCPFASVCLAGKCAVVCPTYGSP